MEWESEFCAQLMETLYIMILLSEGILENREMECTWKGKVFNSFGSRVFFNQEQGNGRDLKVTGRELS